MLMTYLMSYVLYLIHLKYFSLMLDRVMLTCDSFVLVGWTSTPKGGYKHSVSCTECSDCSGLNQFVTHDPQICVDCNEHFWGDDAIFYGALSPHLCKLWGLIYVTIVGGILCFAIFKIINIWTDARDNYQSNEGKPDKRQPMPFAVPTPEPLSTRPLGCRPPPSPPPYVP